MGTDDFGRLLDEKLRPVTKQLASLERRHEKRERERSALLGLCALCLVIAAGSLYFAISRGLELNNSINTNREVVCAQARATAVGYRSRLPHEHMENYVERLVAQRSTLMQAAQLECAGEKGFATFSFLRGRAIHEIEEILGRIAPKRLHELHREEAAGLGASSGTEGAFPFTAGASPPVVPPKSPIGGGGGGGGGPPSTGGGGGGHHHPVSPPAPPTSPGTPASPTPAPSSPTQPEPPAVEEGTGGTGGGSSGSPPPAPGPRSPIGEVVDGIVCNLPTPALCPK